MLQPLTYLLQRVCHNATTIWSLAIDIDGYFLIFIAEKKIKIDKILIPNEEVASWRHVAVTIDTSASISSTYGTSAVITVYFDGKHVKQEVVDVPVVSEDVLQGRYAAYSLTQWLTHSLTHPLAYSLTHSPTHPLAYSLTYSLTLTHLLTHLLTHSY